MHKTYSSHTYIHHVRTITWNRYFMLCYMLCIICTAHICIVYLINYNRFRLKENKNELEGLYKLDGKHLFFCSTFHPFILYIFFVVEHTKKKSLSWLRLYFYMCLWYIINENRSQSVKVLKVSVTQIIERIENK